MLIVALTPNSEKETIRKAFKKAFALAEYKTPIESITLDNGSEFADFLNIEKDLQATIYFADPHSPWQRRLNENTNDILRFFYPKETNFLNISEKEFQEVVHLINAAPENVLVICHRLIFCLKSVALDIIIYPLEAGGTIAQDVSRSNYYKTAYGDNIKTALSATLTTQYRQRQQCRTATLKQG